MKTSGSFVGADIKPLKDSIDSAGMEAGEPGLPMAFVCRKKLYQVEKVIRTWRDTGPCTHGSGEKYVRKNWFEVKTVEGETLTLYFERRSTAGRIRRGWRLFSILQPNC